MNEHQVKAVLKALGSFFNVNREEASEYWDSLNDRERNGYLHQVVVTGRILF